MYVQFLWETYVKYKYSSSWNNKCQKTRKKVLQAIMRKKGEIIINCLLNKCPLAKFSTNMILKMWQLFYCVKKIRMQVHFKSLYIRIIFKREIFRHYSCIKGFKMFGNILYIEILHHWNTGFLSIGDILQTWAKAPY